MQGGVVTMQKIPDPIDMPLYLYWLNSYVLHTCGHSTRVINILAQGDWPCPQCNGLGRDWDPDEIEGNKMRNRITCPDCGGSGHGERSWWKNQWLAVHAQRIAEISAFASVRAVMRQALDKVTTEDAAALGWEKPEPTILETAAAIRKVGDNE